ncbi:MAG TPA: DUF2723 domain-containing protein, partial [Chryseolinea sp.]|nr:DUF2723 domain-containing protein [Chryseolinea sp.]
MFSRKDLSFFLAALLLAAVAYTLMVVDPVEYGFGILTLWIAPPLLLVAFCLPVIGISGVIVNYRQRWRDIKKNPAKQLGGVGVFIIALVIYLITLEPTASLWDCSEFIASAYKLQVPHSPGVPLFLLIARLFSMLVLDDIAMVAPAMNAMSALFSALAVFITYHLIYRFAVLMDGGEKTPGILPVCAALCGSLCVAFSDSFWFSAVEAETYAAAAFFLVLLVWLIISGKDLTREKRSRRLVLIFYVAGLSFCIHPMCLLALPLLPLCWYSEKITSMKKFVLAVGVGLLIVIVINRLVAVGLFELMFSFDLFFVNSFHTPFYSGAIVLLVLMTLLFIFLLRRFRNHSQYSWATIFLLAGFLPYIMLFIRSNHNPPIDETNPEDLALIRAYMNRDSYGSTPLLYGPYFDAEIEGVTVKDKMYYKDRDSYQIAGTTSAYQYDKSRQTILPRMYSNDENHITAYRQWTGLKENEQPGFSDNLEFMFRVQLGEMYFRYFLFNFAGRESDVQYSRWLKPWDSLEGDKSRNQYWMVPLIFGLAGAFYQYYKSRKDFLTIAIFFLVTGALLAIYLNAPPTEPRERDYIYVGSFIAFSIWIGLGIKALGNVAARYKMGLYVLPFIGLLLPGWMGWQNFDDHDRSGRTFQIDNAKNLLQSCAPNSILFTGGDNDTFPLWYLQEVEGFRTDVRVMVLSYLNTDWYINQLRRPYYNSPAFNLSLSEKDYLQYGPNDVLYVNESIKEGIDAKKYLQLLHDEHPALKRHSSGGEPYSIIPSRTLKVPVFNSSASNQTRLTVDSDSNDNEIALDVKGNYLTKNALALLDLLISNEWKRPVYFNFTSYNQIDLNVVPYLVQEGLVYRLMPQENRSKDVEADTQLMYENLITNASYENLLQTDIYFNHEDFQARMVEPLRSAFNELAVGLLNEGDEVKA